MGVAIFWSLVALGMAVSLVILVGKSVYDAMASEPDELREPGEPDANCPVAPGDRGIVSTPLRPTGRVEFGNRTVEVKSTGAFIETGRPVRVVQCTRAYILVKASR
jgi:membrane-bound ClpP family serine protease